jgi:hypothetical protein
MKTIMELAAEVQRQSDAKKDYVADTSLLNLEPAHYDEETKKFGGTQLVMQNGKRVEFEVNELFHQQLGDKYRIPNAFYDEQLKDDPELICHVVNRIMHRESEQRMIRTLDGKARAFLSRKYRPLDSQDMLEAVMPALAEMKMEVKSAEITEKRLYLKAIFTNLQADVVPGDAVQGGIVISNSEVGAGSFKVEPFTWRLVCKNGLISEHALRKYHVGRARGGDEEDTVYELLGDEARSADDRALFLKVRDLVKYSVKPEIFATQVDRFREATTLKITGNIPVVVEVIRKKFGFGQEQGASILRHLIEGGDLSQWGAVNAVTRSAQDLVNNYDAETWTERAGGKILELSKNDWQKIATAN